MAGEPEKPYEPQKIEARWQKIWTGKRSFAAPDRPDPKRKFYVLEMFPYPSGNLHMGHVRNYVIGDLIARYQRAIGREVLHPMGWDALGLPAENAAIKDGVHPAVRTDQNIKNVKRQMQMLGLSYDWEREIATCLPEYYRWNQWFFLKFHEKGLIYKRETEVNWCPKDMTVLANEQVEDGRCWRCETIVERRKMPEWAFAITKYAQALLDGIETLVEGGWPDRVTTMQRNWIGKSVGLECDFEVVHQGADLGSGPSTGGWIGDSPDLSQEELTKFLAKRSGAPAINLDEFDVDPETARLVPKEFARANMAIPVYRGGDSLIVAMANPNDKQAATALKGITGLNIEPVAASKEAINRAIERYSERLKIRVFTTRADTIHGATYVVVAPEHPIVTKITTPSRKKEVEAFVAKMKATDKIARTAEGAPKEGVDTGARAKNPFTDELIPVYLANFVLADYGTGAVMSVPAHDQRDFEFAKKYQLPIRVVIAPKDGQPADAKTLKEAFVEDGILVDSKGFSGKDSSTARDKIAEMAERGGFGQKSTKWHLRDWGFSRQRYWGTPIPVVYCEKDGMQLVPEKDLPVVLPRDVKLTGDGGPPLAKAPDFVKAKCPKCGGPARREVETMDTFVDSTWYYARFLDPKSDKAPFAREKADAWLPVDIYIGGPEHAVLHLLYFRFWTMVMKELGLCATPEPAKKLLTQGMVIAKTWKCPEHGYLDAKSVKDDKCPKDGTKVVPALEKMSKSKGNGVAPDEMVEKFGADTARVYSLFKSPPEKDLEWEDRDVVGSFNFLRKVWAQVQAALPLVKSAPALDPAALPPAAKELWRKTHETIGRVTDAVGKEFHYNVGVAALMELVNQMGDLPPAEKESPQGRAVLKQAVESMLVLLAPYAPHIAEELWEALGHQDGIVAAGWPSVDPKALARESVMVVVQVNGKKRGEIEVPASADQSTVEAAARGDAKIKSWLDGKELAKVVYVARSRLLNLVVK